MTSDDSRSNYSGRNSFYDRPSKMKPGYPGYERDQMNRATQLKEFPRCERHFGKVRWSKVISTLNSIGFVNWEINTMLEALDKLAEKRELTEADNKKSLSKKRKISEPKTNEPVKVPHVEPEKVAAIECKEPNVISDILTPVDEKQEEIFYLDLRACIGDASHPEFRILLEHRRLLQIELDIFVTSKLHLPKPIISSFYINETLVVDCKKSEIMELLKTRLSELNERLWPGAKMKLLPRTGVRQKIQICIPYLDLKTKDILEIIKNQNKLKTESWDVVKRKDLDDGIRLDVEVDENTNLRILRDQEDLFFLLTRATVKLPGKDEE